jgi:hypothetical protein
MVVLGCSSVCLDAEFEEFGGEDVVEVYVGVGQIVEGSECVGGVHGLGCHCKAVASMSIVRIDHESLSRDPFPKIVFTGFPNNAPHSANTRKQKKSNPLIVFQQLKECLTSDFLISTGFSCGFRENDLALFSA